MSAVEKDARSGIRKAISHGGRRSQHDKKEKGQQHYAASFKTPLEHGAMWEKA